MSPNLTVKPVPTVKAAKGSTAEVTLKASLPSGYHANSNKPAEAYLIPLTLKWTGGPLQMLSVTYPQGTMEKYSFSDKPLSVVTGEFSITTKFRVPAEAASGPAAQTGTLRYQACDNKACYPPKNVPVNVTVSVE
ncbi:MAG TPA: protein-disulfide reductase DsbD domain-containing protein [Bryobacteraceae bacterium]|nr:protein-disulfide reductase DsbD domain-containing protein [Bryobacteraceae bacterium]